MCFSGSSTKPVQPPPDTSAVAAPNGSSPQNTAADLPPQLTSVPLAAPISKTYCPPATPTAKPEETPVAVNVESDLPAPADKAATKQPDRAKQVDKALLKVRVFEDGDESKVIVAAKVTSTLAGSRQTQMDGVADFRQVATGKHVITVALQGDAAKNYFPPDPAESTLKNGDNVTVDVPVKPQISWIEIRLVDSDGNPVANEKYQLRLPDGSSKDGTLDDEGKVRFESIKPGDAEVCFPDIHAKEWVPQ